MERAGRSVREHLALEGDRLTSSLDYGFKIEDVFSWRVFAPEELAAAARADGLELLDWAFFEEDVPPCGRPAHATRLRTLLDAPV